jgi:hypothetical protein
MSRGRGVVQRGIVIALTRTPLLSVPELASRVYQCRLDEVTEDHLDATRRALKKLVADKVVREAPYSSGAGRPTWELVGPRLRRPTQAQQRAKRIKLA